MTEYIPGFKAKLQDKIDLHEREAVRLTIWRDQLDAEGFNWEEVTEAQAWAIWSLNCAKSEQEAAK